LADAIPVIEKTKESKTFEAFSKRIGENWYDGKRDFRI
jgi:hypothetical protein